MNRDGFTLVEILVAVAIIGVLSVFFLAKVTKIIKRRALTDSTSIYGSGNDMMLSNALVDTK